MDQLASADCRAEGKALPLATFTGYPLFGVGDRGVPRKRTLMKEPARLDELGRNSVGERLLREPHSIGTTGLFKRLALSEVIFRGSPSSSSKPHGFAHSKQR